MKMIMNAATKEVETVKKERDLFKSDRAKIETQLNKTEAELEKSKTIFINSYDNQKKFIDATEKHSSLLIS